MSKETIEIIAKQTGVSDLIHVEKVFYECNGDEVSTIFKLMDMPLPDKKDANKPRTLFDDLRDICDEKDTLFQDFLQKNRDGK